MNLVRRIAAVALAAALMNTAPSSANAAVQLRGSFDQRVLKPRFTSLCAPGVIGQCGVMQLDGFGPADFTYVFGPTFEPTGRLGCAKVDGTFTLVLESDGSSISGPLTGVFCEPGRSGPAGGKVHPFGNPFTESDTITFTAGTGEFSGLAGVGDFHQSGAGAVYRGTLEANLTAP